MRIKSLKFNIKSTHWNINLIEGTFLNYPCIEYMSANKYINRIYLSSKCNRLNTTWIVEDGFRSDSLILTKKLYYDNN